LSPDALIVTGSVFGGQVIMLRSINNNKPMYNENDRSLDPKNLAK
jgi:hypothetical protein